MRFAYRIVDVFSDRPLAGNALCVVLDPVPPPVMPALAREVNLSETTFPVVIADGEYEVRIFTPGAELPFAGHPTLGTAWVLGPGRWTQRSEGATVGVEATAEGASMAAPEPTFHEVDAGPAVAALGLPGAEGAFVAEAGGIRHLLVPTDAPLGDVGPDLAAVAALQRRHRTASVAPMRRIDHGTLHVRVFCPGLGIAEDPGTGSAAGPIGRLARQRWGLAADLTIRQGDEIGRACRIQVHAGTTLVVSGAVVPVAEGSFTL
ncbi:MAG: PhzF family phenazine biosynthesis protein [Acidimicrobiales bacterium]